jgi:hypothetical protein
MGQGQGGERFNPLQSDCKTKGRASCRTFEELISATIWQKETEEEEVWKMYQREGGSVSNNGSLNP